MENGVNLSGLGTAELKLFYNISVGIMEAEKDGMKIEQIVECLKNELKKRYREAV